MVERCDHSECWMPECTSESSFSGYFHIDVHEGTTRSRRVSWRRRQSIGQSTRCTARIRCMGRTMRSWRTGYLYTCLSILELYQINYWIIYWYSIKEYTHTHTHTSMLCCSIKTRILLKSMFILLVNTLVGWLLNHLIIKIIEIWLHSISQMLRFGENVERNHNIIFFSFYFSFHSSVWWRTRKTQSGRTLPCLIAGLTSRLLRRLSQGAAREKNHGIDRKRACARGLRDGPSRLSLVS